MVRLCIILLFAAIGAGTALALPTATSDITYFPTETSNFTQVDDIGFAARGPPMAAANVAIKGGVTVVHGGVFSFHRYETVVASLGFGDDSVATNKTVRVDVSDVRRGTPEYDALNNPRPNTTTELSNGTSLKQVKGGMSLSVNRHAKLTPVLG